MSKCLPSKKNQGPGVVSKRIQAQNRSSSRPFRVPLLPSLEDPPVPRVIRTPLFPGLEDPLLLGYRSSGPPCSPGHQDPPVPRVGGFHHSEVIHEGP
ncbi:unnamed protein product [Boreogadus saida]